MSLLPLSKCLRLNVFKWIFIKFAPSHTRVRVHSATPTYTYPHSSTLTYVRTLLHSSLTAQSSQPPASTQKTLAPFTPIYPPPSPSRDPPPPKTMFTSTHTHIQKQKSLIYPHPFLLLSSSIRFSWSFCFVSDFLPLQWFLSLLHASKSVSVFEFLALRRSWFFVCWNSSTMLLVQTLPISSSNVCN